MPRKGLLTLNVVNTAFPLGQGYTQEFWPVLLQCHDSRHQPYMNVFVMFQEQTITCAWKYHLCCPTRGHKIFHWQSVLSAKEFATEVSCLLLTEERKIYQKSPERLDSFQRPWRSYWHFPLQSWSVFQWESEHSKRSWKEPRFNTI